MSIALQIRRAIDLPSLVGRIQLPEAIILWGLALVGRLTTGVGVWLFTNILSVVTEEPYTGAVMRLRESQPQVETL